MRFDDLWEQEELHALTRRLQREYPAALRRHRRLRATVASVAVAAVALMAFFTVQSTLSHATRGYDMVCCNRTTFPDSHWVEVAANMLTAEMS